MRCWGDGYSYVLRVGCRIGEGPQREQNSCTRERLWWRLGMIRNQQLRSAPKASKKDDAWDLYNCNLLITLRLGSVTVTVGWCWCSGSLSMAGVGGNVWLFTTGKDGSGIVLLRQRRCSKCWFVFSFFFPILANNFVFLRVTQVSGPLVIIGLRVVLYYCVFVTGFVYVRYAAGRWAGNTRPLQRWQSWRGGAVGRSLKNARQ